MFRRPTGEGITWRCAPQEKPTTTTMKPSGAPGNRYQITMLEIKQGANVVLVSEETLERALKWAKSSNDEFPYEALVRTRS